MKRRIKNSQRACALCGKGVTVNEDGLLRVHGPRNNRCPGKSRTVVVSTFGRGVQVTVSGYDPEDRSANATNKEGA